MSTLIQVSKVKKSYGSFQVLQDISFEGAVGECVCFTGKNGCGKSTLLSWIAGVDRPDEGEILFAGGQVQRGYLPQTNPLILSASVRDNLNLWCSDKNQLLAAADRFDLGSILRKRVSRLSGGMKRRVALACAMASDPRILIMDEPTAGLDIEYKESIRNEMIRHMDRGGLLIMVSHEAEEIRLAERPYLLDGGFLKPYTGSLS